MAPHTLIEVSLLQRWQQQQLLLLWPKYLAVTPFVMQLWRLSLVEILAPELLGAAVHGILPS